MAKDLWTLHPYFPSKSSATESHWIASEQTSPYVLLRAIGEGGMGRVWLAERRRTRSALGGAMGHKGARCRLAVWHPRCSRERRCGSVRER
jgi:hypothetical protein